MLPNQFGHVSRALYAGCAPLAPTSTEDSHSRSLLYSDSPCWTSLWLIFETSAVLPQVFRVVTLSALLNRVFLSFLLPIQQLRRIVLFQWLTLALQWAIFCNALVP